IRSLTRRSGWPILSPRSQLLTLEISLLLTEENKTMEKRHVVKLGVICLAVMASAIFLPSASAGVIGTLFTGSSGEVTVTTTSITWDTDPGSISSGTWNGEVANGTNLTFQGCASGVLGSAGCLFNGEGVDINHLAALVNGVTPIPIDG